MSFFNISKRELQIPSDKPRQAVKKACNYLYERKHYEQSKFDFGVVLTRYMSFIAFFHCINSLSPKFITWSNTLKQFAGKLPTNCLSVFDHFVGLAGK